jgi:hypothetical protein
MIIEHTNRIHAAACAAAKGTRQQEVSAAIVAGSGGATVAAAVRTAEIKFTRAVITSAVANGQVRSVRASVT